MINRPAGGVAAEHQRRKPWLLPGLLAGVLLLVGGCRRGPDQRFIPSEEAARHTLEAALAAWQNGKVPPGLVQEASPAVHLVDTQHRPGQKLAAFTVLGPTTGEAPRCYAVRLTLDEPREEVRARYVVVGLDPLWVLRYEDYEMISHWDHAMPEEQARPKAPQS
jgi:hypothetical protein